MAEDIRQQREGGDRRREVSTAGRAVALHGLPYSQRFLRIRMTGF